MKLCKYCQTLFKPRTNNQLTCDDPKCQQKKKQDKAKKNKESLSVIPKDSKRSHHKKDARYGGYFERGIVEAAERLVATHSSVKNHVASQMKSLEDAAKLHTSFDTGERVQHSTGCRFCNKPEVDTKLHLCSSEECIGKHERLIRMVQESGFYG